MNDEDMIIARDLLHTVIDFIENGKVDSLVEEEIMNYFRMCHQVEIYYEKFAMKGFYIRVEHGTGNFSLNVTPDESPGSYDFGRLADKFFELFCRPSVPSSILARATRAYRREIGNERLALCVQSFANLKKSSTSAASVRRWATRVSYWRPRFSSKATWPSRPSTMEWYAWICC